MLTTTKIDEEVTAIVAAILEMDEAELHGKRDKHFFDDLGLDSLLALEIIASCEKKYKIEIEEERLAEITTLNDTISLIKELVEDR